MYNEDVAIVLSLISTLIIIFLIPIAIYGLFSKYLGIKEPEKKTDFFIGVLIQKLGTSLGFVLLYYIGMDIFSGDWLIYSLIWFLMFAITEIGQTYMSNYSNKEAIAGLISELIYFPLAGLMLSLLSK